MQEVELLGLSTNPFNAQSRMHALFEDVKNRLEGETNQEQLAESIIFLDDQTRMAAPTPNSFSISPQTVCKFYEELFIRSQDNDALPGPPGSIDVESCQSGCKALIDMILKRAQEIRDDTDLTHDPKQLDQDVVKKANGVFNRLVSFTTATLQWTRALQEQTCTLNDLTLPVDNEPMEVYQRVLSIFRDIFLTNQLGFRIALGQIVCNLTLIDEHVTQRNTRVRVPLCRARSSDCISFEDYAWGMAAGAHSGTYNEAIPWNDRDENYLIKLRTDSNLRCVEHRMTNLERHSLRENLLRVEGRGSRTEDDNISKPIGESVFRRITNIIRNTNTILPVEHDNSTMEARTFADGILVMYSLEDPGSIVPKWYSFDEGNIPKSVVSANLVQEYDSQRVCKLNYNHVWRGLVDDGYGGVNRICGLESATSHMDVWNVMNSAELKEYFGPFLRFYVKGHEWSMEQTLYHIEWTFAMVNFSNHSPMRALTYWEGVSGAGKTTLMSAYLSWVGKSNRNQFNLPPDSWPLSEFAHEARDRDQVYYCPDAQSKAEIKDNRLAPNLLYQVIDRQTVSLYCRNIGKVDVTPTANMFIASNGTPEFFHTGGSPDALWRRSTPTKFTQSLLDRNREYPNDKNAMQEHCGAIGLVGLKLMQLRCQQQSHHWFNCSTPMSIEPNFVREDRRRMMHLSNPICQVLLNPKHFRTGSRLFMRAGDMIDRMLSVNKSIVVGQIPMVVRLLRGSWPTGNSRGDRVKGFCLSSDDEGVFSSASASEAEDDAAFNEDFSMKQFFKEIVDRGVDFDNDDNDDDTLRVGIVLTNNPTDVVSIEKMARAYDIYTHNAPGSWVFAPESHYGIQWDPNTGFKCTINNQGITVKDDQAVQQLVENMNNLIAA